MKHYSHIIEIRSIEEAWDEMQKIGVRAHGLQIMGPKAIFRAVKVFGISVTAANIVKQEMLARGGEVAVAHGAINYSIKTTDLLILGTLSQFQALLFKLRQHQFKLPALADQIEEALSNYAVIPFAIKIGKTTFHFGKRTYLMGILNVTPDSFSDGGKFFGVQQAVEKALAMVKEGADIIDVGGESTRPGARKISVKEELKRVLPVIKGIRKQSPVPLSIDTRKAAVAKAAIAAGADMVNDVSGLRFDNKMAAVIARAKVPVCIMHMRGVPANMQKKIEYKDLLQEMLDFMLESIAIAENAGILRQKIILDPGIGFGKTVKQNLEILRNLREFRGLGRPLLVGVSRKSFIGNILNVPVEERLEGTASAVALAVANGADMVRVHDVGQMQQVCKITDAIVRRRG